MEEQVLAQWSAAHVRERWATRNSGGPAWRCHERPRPASGLPGLHHARALVVGDVYARYHAMRGFHVAEITGWDCHGLAVEEAVERELGLTGPADVEAYGIEQFTARCREFARRHIDAFSLFVRRLGYACDESRGSQTMDPGCVESVWWSLRRLFDAGLLARERRVGLYCPRCQTPLAGHDIGHPGGRRPVTGETVTVRLRLLSPPREASPMPRGCDLLVRTTRPWTLMANVAVAVHPTQTYAIARKTGQDGHVVVAEPVFARTLGEGWYIVARVSGAELAGARYEPAFSLVSAVGSHRVIAAGFVRATIGTGLVPLAPAFGTHDMTAAAAHDLPVFSPLGPDGRFDPELPLVGGVFVIDSDQILVENLADRGLLFARGPRDRDYPRCSHCSTPLIMRSQLGWHIGDWTLSRARFWGTPLPIWECANGHLTCVGSLAELSAAAGSDLTGLDPHRPQLDQVEITCAQCGSTGRRVSDVVDSWYDCASMPFARPAPGDPDAREPPVAQLAVAEAGRADAWHHALTVIAGLVFGTSAFETGISVGAVADHRGRVTDRSTGTVIAPAALIDRHGADAIRWTCAASTPPNRIQRWSAGAVPRPAEKILFTYVNTARFLATCRGGTAARGGDWPPGGLAASSHPEPAVLDRWALSELNLLIGAVTDALDAHDTPRACRRISCFINDLSNWYLRRSRRHIADEAAAPPGSTAAAAIVTLHTCLQVVTRLLAPITPFLADYVWALISADPAADSVHLTDWPTPASSLVDLRLADQMALARRLARLGRSARASARIGLRQPLARALVAGPGFADLSAELRMILATELNVEAIGPLSGRPPAGWAVATDRRLTVALDAQITPDLRYQGLARQIIRAIQDARKRLGLAVGDRIWVHWSSADPDLVVAMARHRGLIRTRTRAMDLARWLPHDRGHAAGAQVEPRLDLTFWLGRATTRSPI